MSTVDFRLTDMKSIDADLRIIWRKITDGNIEMQSPFFTPEYFDLMTECGLDVRVVVIENHGKAVGFFPLEIESDGNACPVGNVFSDYQAVIAFSNAHWSVGSLMQAAGLESWRFDHLLAGQKMFDPFVLKRDVSWAVDIRRGFDSYFNELSGEKRSILKEIARKKRKLEREIGEVEFTHHIVDHELLATLLKWKSDQWVRSGWENRFSTEWEQKMMHSLLEADYEYFKGAFSLLRADGEPIALHLGMRSRNVWHLWTTAYNELYGKYSPGIIKLVEMIKTAAQKNMWFVDLGKEDFLYKRRLHNYKINLMEGKYE